MLPLMISALLLAAVPDRHPSQFVGDYDGGQMEMAAGLELDANGRFKYGVSYGGLDEQADGTWRSDGASVILDSDPVNAPRFTLVDRSQVPDGIVRVDLQVPSGMDVQYFEAAISLSDKTEIGGQLSRDGLSRHVDPGQRVVSVRILLPMFEQASEPVAAGTQNLLGFHFRFEPNDLGHVAFQGTRLAQDHGDLVLQRFNRIIRFRRQSK